MVISRTVDGHLAGRNLFAPTGDAHSASEVQSLASIVEARNGIVDDDQHLLAVAAGRKEWAALSLPHPELELLAPELGQQRSQNQKQEGSVRDEGRELHPTEAIGEKVARPVARIDLNAVVMAA